MNGVVSVGTSKSISLQKGVYLFLVLLTFLALATIALTAAVLGVVINRLDRKNSSIVTTEVLFANEIKIDELMKHLERLQNIADESNGTRAIATPGFNRTLEYIRNQLEQNTNLIVNTEYFTVKNYVIRGTPQLQSQMNGASVNHIYGTDFAQILFSARADFVSFVQLVPIPNLGCQDTDWMNVSVIGKVALVKRGDCGYVDKTILAEKYQAKAVLIYNDGIAPDRLQVILNIRNNLNATIPAYFLSYDLGKQLLDNSPNAQVMMNIDVSDANGIGNICADTPTGDPTKTIVVGAHSDSVPAGSGINDNGSGTVGVLVLAMNLARLLSTSTLNYSSYKYRIRFCWWGAEELGLIGSRYHVAKAALSTTTTEGERLKDYLLNFNYDMLAGPNYRFGIHDSSTIPADTPLQALYGTKQIMNVFRQWFTEQKLPWSNSSLGGGSDYVPFLAAGIAVGGVNTGAGGIKPPSERDLYSSLLGIGNGGIPNVAYDTCYHRDCDRITNINTFAYEKVVKSAAHAIESVARLNDLEKWLYPVDRGNRKELFTINEIYNFKNDPDFPWN